MAVRKRFDADVNPMEQAIINSAARSVAPETAPKGPPPAGHRINPFYIESRTRRLYLIIPPSLYDRLKARSVRDKVSVNELANTFIEAGLSKD